MRNIRSGFCPRDGHRIRQPLGEYPVMRQSALAFSATVAVAVLGGCAAPSEPKPTVQDGWTVYAESHIRKPINCQGGNVQLNGDRLDTHLTNACQAVRVTGAHNDVQVDIAPGGTIEITGS